VATDGPLVLVVDDEPLMHVITSRVLDEAGFELLNATDGVAAIELLNRTGRVPALVITDMRMPRMGGAELGRWLAERHPAVPVLYVSGYTADQDRPPVPASELPRHWLAKPFSPDQLLACVLVLHQRSTSLHLHRV
jgi:two-component system, cell cycle sensor histidine kinase and response regulator CckA